MLRRIGAAAAEGMRSLGGEAPPLVLNAVDDTVCETYQCLKIRLFVNSFEIPKVQGTLMIMLAAARRSFIF